MYNSRKICETYIRFYSHNISILHTANININCHSTNFELICLTIYLYFNELCAYMYFC